MVKTIVPLIQVKACLVPFPQIDKKLEPVFANHYIFRGYPAPGVTPCGAATLLCAALLHLNVQ